MARDHIPLLFSELPVEERRRAVSSIRMAGKLGVQSTTRSFRRNQSGAVAVEFAIISVPLFGFIFLIFQVALYHFGLQSLDHATRSAGRQIMIGGVSQSVQNPDQFKTNLICPNVLFNIACDRLIVNAYKVNETSNEAIGSNIYRFIDAEAKALRTSSTQTTFCLGGPSDYIFLDVAYPFPNFVGRLLTRGDDPTPQFMLRSTSFFRNEPYTTAGRAC